MDKLKELMLMLLFSVDDSEEFWDKVKITIQDVHAQYPSNTNAQEAMACFVKALEHISLADKELGLK